MCSVYSDLYNIYIRINMLGGRFKKESTYGLIHNKKGMSRERCLSTLSLERETPLSLVETG